MNKKANLKSAIRAVLLCMLALLLPALNSCKKESVNLTDLLATVPSSSSVVVGINVESMLKKANCKVDGSQIIPGKEVQSFLNGDSFKNSKNGKIAAILLNGESGIDPIGSIFFKDAYNDYLTFALADTGKFKSFIEQETGETFSAAGNDVQVCANVAIKGAQAWVTDGTTIDAKAISNYSSLDSGQSFLSKDFSEKIATMTSDIVGWGEIKKILDDNLGFSQRSTLNLGLGILFEEAQSIVFSIDMLKGEAKASMSVYNKDGKPAKYLLPSDKINAETVKKIGSSANAVFALSITKDLIKKFDSLLSSFGGEMSKAADALKSVDGTAALALSNMNSLDNISGIVTTDGKAGLPLMQMISAIAPITKDGKFVLFSKGALSGELEVATAADYLKNATLGMVINVAVTDLNKRTVNDLKTVVVAFEPKSGSVECKVTLKAADESRNILLPLIDTFAD